VRRSGTTEAVRGASGAVRVDRRWSLAPASPAGGSWVPVSVDGASRAHCRRIDCQNSTKRRYNILFEFSVMEPAIDRVDPGSGIVAPDRKEL
jgi:hypothetical protein